LCQVAVNGSRTYFDTNVPHHHHFYVDGENYLLDVSKDDLVVDYPMPPQGYERTGARSLMGSKGRSLYKCGAIAMPSR